MKPKNQIYYWTECGCRLHEKDLKRSYNIKTCREHGKLVFKRTRVCADCGKEFIMKGKRGAAIRCEPCNKIQKRMIAKKNADKQYKKRLAEAGKVRKEQAKAAKMLPPKRYINPIPKKMRPFVKSWRGDYCRKLTGCMLYHKVLPCAGCDNFVGIFKGVDPGKNSS